jgi:hypothetical protein
VNADTWTEIAGELAQCLTLAESANAKVAGLFGQDVRFFKPVTLQQPTRGCGELVFLRSVLWFYGLLHECGGRPLRFCCRQSQFPKIEDEEPDRFVLELHQLRTHVGHNLDGSSERDQLVEYSCRKWYQTNCGMTHPSTDAHWNMCTLALLRRARALLDSLNRFLDYLATTPDVELLVDALKVSVLNQFSPYAFDPIIEAAARDMGRSLYPEAFRVQHLPKWQASLDKLPEGFDFQREARILIEDSLLETPAKRPITGTDIIQELGVPMGPEVGKWLTVAKQLIEQGITDRQALLDRLREERRKAGG